uniref:Uncharacterized protein n=1 Tax=Timema bartmani TaxID=61472 RepID=A0A7R9I7W6_9NEOP|nr:unnamed protein product [Timema bartmani]
MNVKMVYLLTTVLVSMMTALSSASRSDHLDNYIRIRNNYLIPLAQAASEAYNASFDDAFKMRIDQLVVRNYLPYREDFVSDQGKGLE